MKKLLWISLRAPYDAVSHAGGKTHNFYIKKFKESNLFDLQLLSFCYASEKSKLDLNEYRIKNNIYEIPRNDVARKFLGKVGLPISLLEYNFIKKKIRFELKKLRKENKEPDIVVLHWTEIVMLYPWIKKYFPTAKIVCVEEDVTFLKMQRKEKQAKGMKKWIVGIQRLFISQKELGGLIQANLVITNNKKDYKLIKESGVDQAKIVLVSPYYDDYSFIKRCETDNSVVYWGAMNRPENSEAVIWFAHNVLPHLSGAKFIVIGANPTEEVLELKKEGVIVTGFVDSPVDFFEKCSCLVVPLKMGAGIKVKVLEGMSAGIPVLTNDIGIEGIDSENGIDYIHCENANDYIVAIKTLHTDMLLQKRIGESARKRIANDYDMDRDIQLFIRQVDRL